MNGCVSLFLFMHHCVFLILFYAVFPFPFPDAAEETAAVNERVFPPAKYSGKRFVVSFVSFVLIFFSAVFILFLSLPPSFSIWSCAYNTENSLLFNVRAGEVPFEKNEKKINRGRKNLRNKKSEEIAS